VKPEQVELLSELLQAIAEEYRNIIEMDGKKAGPQPAWDTSGGEQFSESGQNFLNYVQYIFLGEGRKFCRGVNFSYSMRK